MEQSNEELEPLFDYSRVQPNIISIDDDDDGSDSGKAPKLSPKRRKKSDSVVCLDEESCEAPKVVIDCDEEDWLLPPPPMVSKPAQKLGHEDLTLKELRLKKQELASFALSPEDVLRAVEELARKEISTSATPLHSEADSPAKALDDRAKIVISIQDKDELKQFRVYMDDKFERLFKMYAEKVKCDIQSLVFSFDGDKLDPSATPRDLGMENDDIIEVLAMSNLHAQADKPAKAHSDRAKIVISIQDKNELKQFRIYMDDKFERLFKMYAEKVKRDIQSLVFFFDGDKVSPSATPGSLGMEDDDIIEVRVKSS